MNDSENSANVQPVNKFTDRLMLLGEKFLSKFCEHLDRLEVMNLKNNYEKEKTLEMIIEETAKDKYEEFCEDYYEQIYKASEIMARKVRDVTSSCKFIPPKEFLGLEQHTCHLLELEGIPIVVRKGYNIQTCRTTNSFYIKFKY